MAIFLKWTGFSRLRTLATKPKKSKTCDPAMSLTKKTKSDSNAWFFYVFLFFYVFSSHSCGSACVLNSSPGIILRVQNRKIAYHIILRAQKSVLIPIDIWPHHISGGVNSGSYMATCAGTWSYHLVFLFFCFFLIRVSNGSSWVQSA